MEGNGVEESGEGGWWWFAQGLLRKSSFIRPDGRPLLGGEGSFAPEISSLIQNQSTWLRQNYNIALRITEVQYSTVQYSAVQCSTVHCTGVYCKINTPVLQSLTNMKMRKWRTQQRTMMKNNREETMSIFWWFLWTTKYLLLLDQAGYRPAHI